MFETLGMPSASDARYGAPPAASKSPRRCNSSVKVTRSIACWLSPSEIICVKTRRCWSRKKSSGRRFSIATFSALLSSRIAPSTERSASRLFGSGFSRVGSTGMRGLLCVRLFFAFVPRSAREGKRGEFYSRYENFLIQAMPHCARKHGARQPECLCIASEIVAKLFPAPLVGSASTLYQFSREESSSARWRTAVCETRFWLSSGGSLRLGQTRGRKERPPPSGVLIIKTTSSSPAGKDWKANLKNFTGNHQASLLKNSAAAKAEQRRRRKKYRDAPGCAPIEKNSARTATS